MAKCTHPFLLVSLREVRKPYCTKCKTTLPAPTIWPEPAPPDLVTPVREFLHLLKSAEAATAQVNPRFELQLILAMSDAVHAIDAAAEADSRAHRHPGASIHTDD